MIVNLSDAKVVINEQAQEIKRLRKATGSTALLIKALEFYANGNWHDEYPCGVKINDDTLDFGDTAKEALKKYKSKITCADLSAIKL